MWRPWYSLLCFGILALICASLSAAPVDSLLDLQDAVVAITEGGTEASDIIGTGFLVSADGLVITAEHVIPPNAKTVVVLHREQGGKMFRPHEARSEERRVGKECRSRWSPYH